jgi:thimet oligopeptidase
MKEVYKIVLSIIMLHSLYVWADQHSYTIPFVIQTPEQVRDLFPTTVNELISRVDMVLEEARVGIEEIIATPPLQRTFDTVVLRLDRLSARLGCMASVAWTLKNTNSDAALRQVAEEQMLRMQAFSIDAISYNHKLYETIKACALLSQENATEEEKKYLQETLEGFEKSGLNLPIEQQELIKKIKKELAELQNSYISNIASDTRFIAVSYEELAGLDDAFINALQQDEQGRYVLGVDYPTYFTVLENCSVESTRYGLWKEFNSRAYPVNIDILKEVVKKRDQLARLLGFQSYAQLDLDDAMAKNPARVHAFLDELSEYAAKKAIGELDLLKKELPMGVTLTSDGHIKPWDLAYIRAAYKKKYLDLDEEKIKEYFPMQKTIDELLDIYAQFLGIEFRQVSLQGLWHEDVRYIMAYSKKGDLLGHLLLDLHPRPHKYTHACQNDIVNVMQDKDGTYHPPVLIVIANFPKPTADRPSLLKRSDVSTFFHEFGHAMHSLFGVTEMAGFAGTSVKRDFVEAPSQMLEEWLSDAIILKKVSGHYITGEPLPDSMIEKFRESKLFGVGYATQRQIGLAQFSLQLYQAGEEKDIPMLLQSIHEKTFGGMFIHHSEDHHEAAFVHLMHYGAQYYGYLWSQVFAQDMFNHIKQYGLLNYEIGKQYIEKVIGKGGSVDPEILLEDFLGRKPNMQAFLKDRGFIQ